MGERTFVIVGAGLAGAKAAETLRKKGFDGRVVLLGDETRRPYERPDLSKGYLIGEKQAEELYVHPQGYYAEHDIELRTGTTVAEIDSGRNEVRLADRETLPYDVLLLAPGAAPKRLPVPGGDLPGVVTLRTFEDSDDLRERIRRAAHVVVVGAGWIGCEVAAAARTLGAGVSMIAPEDLPLTRVLGPELGAVYRDVHADHGVDLRLSTGVQEIVGREQAEGVRTSGGEVVPGDLVVIGVGVSPRVQLALEAGLHVEDGVVVDQFLRSSHPKIFAAGDVARAWHPVLQTRVRVEHWANALHQGPAVAGNMLGEQVPYELQPYFYSDQYDVGMEYRGHAPSWDQVVFRGDVPGREFLAFWLSGGRVVAGMNVNVWDQGENIEALLNERRQVDPARLADPEVALSDLG
jgi:3-phenylpropionate/trans-cinnamate dioxygenase ferredoxin reductase subunit